MPTPSQPITSITPSASITATVTLPTTAANTDSAAIIVTVDGAKVGNLVVMNMRSALVAGAVLKQPAYVSAYKTVSFQFRNNTGSEIYSTPGSMVVDIAIL